MQFAVMQEADTQLTASHKDASKKADAPPPPSEQVLQDSTSDNGATAKQNGASLNQPAPKHAPENGASNDAHRPKRCL